MSAQYLHPYLVARMVQLPEDGKALKICGYSPACVSHVCISQQARWCSADSYTKR